MPPWRWYWAVEIDGRLAALPSLLAVIVERLVCHHRRLRKVLWEKQPADWESKLAKTNKKIQTIVYDKKHATIAKSSWVKRATQKMKGKLEFVEGTRKNNHFELIRVEFEVSNEADPAGEGTYYIYSKHYPRQPLRCVTAGAQRNGFDILREAYAGGRSW